LRNDQDRRSFLSARGAAIGAAIGCTLGAVTFYDPDREEVSQRIGWSAAMCVLLSVPGAVLGSILVP
jgi:hypothetical protein